MINITKILDTFELFMEKNSGEGFKKVLGCFKLPDYTGRWDSAQVYTVPQILP